MDEKALAVRILAALLDEPDIEHVAKLPFGKLSFASLPNMNLGCAMNRVAAEAARIAKEARVDALREARDCQPSTAENPNEDIYQRGRFDGVFEYATDIQALIDAETAPKGE